MADPKEIAKAANQVLAGIGGLVAGAYLGPVGATGVQSASSGVNRLIELVVPGASAATPAAVHIQPDSVPRKESAMPPNPVPLNLPAVLSDPEGARAVKFLSERGWSQQELAHLITPAAEPMPPPVAVGASAAPPGLPPGVQMDDVGYWLRALSWQEPALHPELRQQYLANLRLAVDAAGTPGVTPEDIAFWIHVFRTPRLPEEQKQECRRNILEGLVALGVLELPIAPPAGPTT